MKRTLAEGREADHYSCVSIAFANRVFRRHEGIPNIAAVATRGCMVLHPPAERGRPPDWMTASQDHQLNDG